MPYLDSISSIFSIEENIDFISSIFRRERERNIDDIEDNMGEITNSSDRSFLLFLINLFKKKDIS
jgi:hypothetical protein